MKFDLRKTALVAFACFAVFAFSGASGCGGDESAETTTTTTEEGGTSVDVEVSDEGASLEVKSEGGGGEASPGDSSSTDGGH